MGMGKIHLSTGKTLTVTEANAEQEIEKRMGDLVDLLAIFLDAPIDPRAWSQLLVYAPKDLRNSTPN